MKWCSTQVAPPKLDHAGTEDAQKKTLTIAKIRNFHRDPFYSLKAPSRLRIERHRPRNCIGRINGTAALHGDLIGPLLRYPRCARVVWSLLGEEGGSWGLVRVVKGLLLAKARLSQELCDAL